MKNVNINGDQVFIKENSLLARVAAWKLNSANGVAMVLGNTIHLHNVTAEKFLDDKKWLKHEYCHILQYKKLGVAGFLWRYLIESIRHGYRNNRFEIEARQAESA